MVFAKVASDFTNFELNQKKRHISQKKCKKAKKVIQISQKRKKILRFVTKSNKKQTT